MTQEPSERAWKRDRLLGGIAAAIFNITLGLNSVAVPLLAVHSGYTATQIGLLIALPAVAQIAARLTMSALMRKLPDKFFVIASAVLLSVSCALVAISPMLVVFLISQLLQGVARAYFFTGSQTHAVRVSTSAVGALTYLGLASGVGSLIGPVLAGIISERSIGDALWFAAAFGAIGVVPSALLIKLPVFAAIASIEGRVPGRIWRRPGVNTASWMSVTAGAWRGLLGSYAPVVLLQAGQTAAVIGALISVANGAALLGSALSTWARRVGVRFSLIFGALTAGVGIAALGLLAEYWLIAAVVLALSGIGAGILQTVGPAVASEVVHPDERGEAMASTGTFRASALFIAPAGTAGLVAIMPTGVALCVVGLLIAAPALWGGRGQLR
ncbi:MAG: transporter [Homoserinimonas sp.]|nr:transporter [Homoserinimonas sp.]